MKYNLLNKPIILFLLVVATVSCSKKDDSSNNENDQENTSDTLNFSGVLSYNNSSNEMDGIFEYNEETFKFTTAIGSLEGTSTSAGDGVFELSSNTSSGVFENIQLLGNFNNASSSFNLQGSTSGGQSVSFNITTMTVEEANEEWRDNRTKSSVVFSHFEDCSATITFSNGETISGLESYYKEGALCGEEYQELGSIPSNVDNKSTELFCHDVTLLDPDTGEYNTYTICNVARFVLDKNTQYSYTIEWENGEIENGSLTSPDGGLKEYVCITNDGPDCTDNGGGGNGNDILITTDTIEIDFGNSTLPAGDNGVLPFIDPSEFTIYDTTINGDNFSGVVIGDRYSPDTPQGMSDTEIKLYIRYGIENGSYELEWWGTGDSAPIGMDVYYGVNGIPYSSADLPTSGTVVVSNYDEVAKTCTLDFQNVVVSINGGAGTNYELHFSGIIDGNFE